MFNAEVMKPTFIFAADVIIPSGKTTNRMFLGLHYAFYQETLCNQRVLALQGKLVTVIIRWH